MNVSRGKFGANVWTPEGGVLCRYLALLPRRKCGLKWGAAKINSSDSHSTHSPAGCGLAGTGPGTGDTVAGSGGSQSPRGPFATTNGKFASAAVETGESRTPN